MDEIAARERIRQGRGMGASKTKRERDKAELGLEVASHIPFTSEYGSCNAAGTWRGGTRSFGQHRVAGGRHASSVLSNSQARARAQGTIATSVATNAVGPSSAKAALRGRPARGSAGAPRMALAQTYGVDLNQIKW